MKKRFIVAAGMFGFALAALSVWGQAGPTTKITSPKNGANFSGDTVKITWESIGVKIVVAKEAKLKEEGHFHLFVDRDDFKPGVGIPPGIPEIIHTEKSSYELKGLKPGPHKVIVVLSYNNHVPWEPLVTATVTFNTGVKKK